jgi:hypothetical protein
MKKSRFTGPAFRYLPADDVSFELLQASQRMKKSKGKDALCVVIAAKELQDVLVQHDGIDVTMGFVTAQVLWSGGGHPLRAAEIKAATIREEDEDADAVGLDFIQDLQDFFDLYENKTLEEVLNDHFARL